MSYLPEQLITSLANIPGFDEPAFRKAHESGRQVTSIRFNPHKIQDSNFPNNISKKNFPEMNISERVPWSEHGYYLQERPSFFLDPLWHAGIYYVQDASSMCLEFVLRHACDLTKPVRILDLCAAPGGKSTLIAGMISPDSLLVSNEVIGSRTNILEENMIKYGVPNVVVTRNDARDFSKLKEYFDIILVDAPCSGSGLFRKDPEAVKEWSPEQVQLCSNRQKRILADVLPSLKEEGLLIYSTCSYSTEENEDICDYLAQNFSLENIPIPFKPEWNITETTTAVTRAKAYRFYPHKLNGEGFFLSCFKRTDGENIKIRFNERHKKQHILIATLSRQEQQIIKPWLDEADNFTLFFWKNRVWAIPPAVSGYLQMLIPVLKIMTAGINVGKVIRSELIPGHALAMSANIHEDIPGLVLSVTDALAYLRKSDLRISQQPEGWMLATYRNHSLGWIKGVQRRFNNYYPTAWRIQKN